MNMIYTNNIASYTAIAKQCPLIGGTAVFMAQSLLRAQAPDLEFSVDSLCALSGFRVEEVNQEIKHDFNVNIYPNPADAYFLLSGTELINEVIICSLSGTQFYRETINNISATVNTSSLTPGIYFVKVISDKDVRTFKIQIIK